MSARAAPAPAALAAPPPSSGAEEGFAPPGCRLCGGPVPPRAPHGFCCEGCARVSEILDASGFAGDRRASAAFLQAARAGLVPAGPLPEDSGRTAPASGARGEGPALPGTSPATAPAATRQACLSLEGLWCPSCAWLVEEVLQRTPGVTSARVTFFADLAEVSYDPARLG